MPEIITKKEAIEKGLKYYFTGKSCKKGHIDERYLYGTCKTCEHIHSTSKKKLEYNREYYNKNVDYYLEYNKNYVRANREKSRIWCRKYRANNRELANKATAKWKKLNKQQITFLVNKRKEKIKIATPMWANQNKIKAIYLACEVGYHVDHIIPLKGRDREGNHIVCGLHVHYNLQYLTKEENLRKSNKFDLT